MLIRPSGRYFEGIGRSGIENQPSLNWEAPPFLQLRTRIFRPVQDVWGSAQLASAFLSRAWALGCFSAKIGISPHPTGLEY
jgi:hypothetical protein